MRPLVRPFLFAVARLGLFLSVTAWIVGQWWLFCGVAQVNVTHVAGLILHPNKFDLFLTDNIGLANPFYVNSVSVGGKGAELASLDMFMVLHSIGQDATSIPHWLIVTMCGVFYGILKWVYRKKSSESETNA